MRRTALVVLFVLFAAAAGTAGLALIQRDRAAAENPSDVAADFDNDGAADLAVGVPARTTSPVR
jgi:hypothetical protein